MKYTKFSKKHVHVLNSLNRCFANELTIGVLSIYDFKSVNPLEVYKSDNTIIVRFSSQIVEKFPELNNMYGKAECSHNDGFDLQVGIRIARAKLMNEVVRYMKSLVSNWRANLIDNFNSYDKLSSNVLEQNRRYLDKFI